MNPSNPIELLAPAKDADTGIAAINCGADAVYIGAKKFGAREDAGNSVEDIHALCRYAHKYFAKVYVTLNTLLRDEEIPEALKLIAELHDAGIDALIIQDMGLPECDLPPIPLFASTQLHNTSAEKTAFLEKVGFERVILARELDLDRIRDIRSHTQIGLECFVHGALCVSYSGQCYLSYAIGRRSGNRGQCAQPCRRKYSLSDKNGKILSAPRHLLCLKDLNLSEYLKDLIDAGITSFKIEGRLKDTSYVMNIVSFYRQKLDLILQEMNLKKSSSGKSVIDFLPDPHKTFNRGYSRYFIRGRHKSLASWDTPKSLGEKIGRVISAAKDHFTPLPDPLPETERGSICAGDGICFFDKNQQLCGTSINKADGKKIYPEKISGIEKGVVIYRNHDHAFLSQLKKSRAVRSIEVSLILDETPDGFSLTAKDEDGISAEVCVSCQKQPADKKEQAKSAIEKQLAKFGGTEFVCAELVLNLTDSWFIPLSELNALRRNVLEKLSQARQQHRPIIKKRVIPNDAAYPETELSYSGNVLNQKAKKFYQRHGVDRIMPAAESGLDMHGKKLMTTKYCLNYELGRCNGKPPLTPALSPIGERECLYLTDEDGRKFRLDFDCVNCEMALFYEKPF